MEAMAKTNLVYSDLREHLDHRLLKLTQASTDHEKRLKGCEDKLIKLVQDMQQEFE